MYAVMNKKGELFCASDIYEVKGDRLIFVSNGEFVYGMSYRYSKSGDIYTPGNGHKVGSWYYVEGQLNVSFAENSGDLRQLVDNLLPYYGTFNIVTKEVTSVRWRVAGKNDVYNTFVELIYSLTDEGGHNIKIEGIYNLYGKEKIVCNVKYDKIRNRVVEIKLFGMSADSINEVFNYFGNCKFTGNVNTIAVTNGLFTEFGTYKFIDIKENERVYRVKDWSSRGYVLMTEAGLKQLLDRYNKEQRRYRVDVSEYGVMLGINGKYTMYNCGNNIYSGGIVEE